MNRSNPIWRGWRGYTSRGHTADGVWLRRCGRPATISARLGEARSIYVSATPTGSPVGFYLRQGCLLANPAHPVLIAKEPDDIHLLCPRG